jgi:hypothetical protein
LRAAATLSSASIPHDQRLSRPPPSCIRRALVRPRGAPPPCAWPHCFPYLLPSSHRDIICAHAELCQSSSAFPRTVATKPTPPSHRPHGSLAPPPGEQRGCYFCGGTVLPRWRGLLPIDGRPCSDGWPVLLLLPTDVATMGGRPCYKGLPVLLLLPAGVATMGGRSCYFYQPALLHGGGGVATIA